MLHSSGPPSASVLNNGQKENSSRLVTERGFRVWMDGCFDITHCGHALALCLARQEGDSLHVGIQSDATVAKVKGPPVFSEQERYRLVRGIRWVDEVVEDVPYGTTSELLDQQECAICVHGDDAAIAANSEDVLRALMKGNRMKFYRRENSPSTSNIIDRILHLTSTNEISHVPRETFNAEIAITCGQLAVYTSEASPQPQDKVVYVPGTFDLFHVGHQQFLEKAASLGDYLLVGVYDDKTANLCKGTFYPVMSLQERAQRIMVCTCVSDVIAGAPYGVEEEFIKTHKISLVCHGDTPVRSDPSGNDPFSFPKSRGIFETVHSDSSVRTASVVERITCRRNDYESRNELKREKNQSGDWFVKSNGNNLVAETANASLALRKQQHILNNNNM